MQPIIATTQHNRETAIARLEAYIAKSRDRAENAIERIMTEVPQDTISRGGAMVFEKAPEGEIVVRYGFDGSIHSNAMTQLADKCGMSMAYIRHLQDEARAIARNQEEQRQKHGAFIPADQAPNWASSLLARSLTEHAANVLGDNRFLVRSLNGQMRGFLSDKFRRVDCRPGLDTLLGVSNKVGALVTDAIVTDTRASVRILIPRVTEIAPGEFVVLGLSWSNSDYGRGAQSISMFAMRLWCYNGAVLETGLRQIHLGARLSEDITYSDRTMRLDAEATSSAMRDTANVFLSDAKIAETAQLLTAAASENIDAKTKLADLRKRLGKGIAEKVGEAFNRPDVEELPPGNTTWRWSNAISWVAKQPETDIETRLDLEKEAGVVLAKAA